MPVKPVVDLKALKIITKILIVVEFIKRHEDFFPSQQRKLEFPVVVDGMGYLLGDCKIKLQIQC